MRAVSISYICRISKSIKILGSSNCWNPDPIMKSFRNTLSRRVKQIHMILQVSERLRVRMSWRSELNLLVTIRVELWTSSVIQTYLVSLI